MGREDLGAEHDDHANPEEERDLEEDLLQGRGPSDAEDPPHRLHVDPGPGEVEFQPAPPSDQDGQQDEGAHDVRD